MCESVFFSEQSEVAVDGLALAQAQNNRLQNPGKVRLIMPP